MLTQIGLHICGKPKITDCESNEVYNACFAAVVHQSDIYESYVKLNPITVHLIMSPMYYVTPHRVFYGFQIKVYWVWILTVPDQTEGIHLDLVIGHSCLLN